MKYLSISLLAFLLLGCDLDRNEAKVLGDVNRGDLAAVQDFLDEGGNVNLKDEPGMTPLHHAVNGDWKGGNLRMVKLLIDRGANVKATDDTGHTPLHLASNKETAELLIDAGAEVNAKTKRKGETLLFSAAWGAAQGSPKSHQMYLDLTKLLLAKAADVNVKSTSGETTLHKVAQNHSEKHASEVCELLIAHGARVNELNGTGQTPLDVALANGRKETAGILRKHGGRTSKPK